MSGTFLLFTKNRQALQCQLPLSPPAAFWGVSQRWEFKDQRHYKKRFAKKMVSKSLYKKFDQKSKTDFFSIFFSHVFGRFSMRGVQKHDKINIETKNLTLVLFRTLTHPPTTGVTVVFFLAAPCHFPTLPRMHHAPCTTHTHLPTTALPPPYKQYV
jgi:hypothetical protein